MSVSFDVRGYNRTRNSLRRLAADAPELINDDVRDWTRGTRAVLKNTDYPPKRPNQTYVRTGHLGNSFKTKKVGAAQYRLSNTANYASYVIGQDQAWMHKGRWWKMADIANSRAPILVKRITKSLLKVFNGND